MDGVAAGRGRGRNDRGDAQVALRRGRRADPDGAIGDPDVHRVLVGSRVHGHRLDAELVGGADHANRDFASVGDKDPLEHG